MGSIQGNRPHASRTRLITVKYGNRGRGYVSVEAGHVAESLMLQAVALGLATAMVESYGDDAAKHLLHLAANEIPLCLLPVGVP